MIYPLKLRQHVMKVKEQEALTFAETSSRFAISMSSLMRWGSTASTDALCAGKR